MTACRQQHVRAGSLVQLSRGVYGRLNDKLAWHPSFVLLQRRPDLPGWFTERPQRKKDLALRLSP
jgi:hypothetical protein